jgi:hypothetical protein
MVYGHRCADRGPMEKSTADAERKELRVKHAEGDITRRR